MHEYRSIKPKVLAILQHEYPTLRKQFGVEKIQLFGSVSRGTDTPKSDVDLLYVFSPDKDTYDNLFELSEYLEEKFGRKVELTSE